MTSIVTPPGRLVDRRTSTFGGGRRRHGRPPDRAGVKAGICGEALSNHPDLTEKLVENRIDSISVNPDRLLEVKAQMVEIEAHRRMAPDS